MQRATVKDREVRVIEGGATPMEVATFLGCVAEQT